MSREAMPDWRSVLWSALPYLTFVALCAAANRAFSGVTLSLFTNGVPLSSIGLLILVGLIGARVSYRDVPPAVSIVLRITLAFSVFYLVTSRMVLSPAVVGRPGDLGLIVNYVWVIAAFFGLIALVRPSFGLLPLYYIHMQKQALAAVFGVPISSVDYMTIIDTAGLLIIASLLLPLFANIQRRSAALSLGPNRPDQLGLMEAVLLAGVSLHFGNYFFGALGKIAVGGDLMFWVFENRTEYLILASSEAGVNPLSFSDSLLRSAYEWFSLASPLFNFATLAGQLFCVVLVVRPRLAMLTTAFFDLMHIGIFVLTGIFFWKFILLNLAIVLGLRRMIGRRIPPLFAVSLIGLVVVSPALFHINYFYWLDTRSMNSVRFWAVDDEGQEYRVPASYFLGISVTMNQQRLINPEHGPFPTWTWGTTRNRAEMRASETCELERIAESGAENRYFVTKQRIRNALRRYHAHVLENVDEDGLLAYDFYPHHIFSVPWKYRAFRTLDKRRIQQYRYSIEAVCLGYEDGAFSRQIQWHDGFDIPLD
ncbi:MAG: hypothetical protein OEN23_18505 [Paracoccaceae bacterium]|nr:hypothetical protein [Paracoccaceae bacterium]